MPRITLESIPKLDAAIRQTEAAIDLYFLDYDPCATHTLAFAAYGILRDLNAKDNQIDLYSEFEWAKDEEERQKLKVASRRAANFFKHSDRTGDKDDSWVELNSRFTEMFIYDCCRAYASRSRSTQRLAMFAAWFLAHNLDVESISEIPKEAIARILDEYKSDEGRRFYYDHIARMDNPLMAVHDVKSLLTSKA
ncbi:MAG: hypothetical protein Q8922_14745 [Bacteroidota bacterium]|nr:hypothetical protein [Bacteroidota bacterium]MDP4234535.1 hypothetical protein [Bacteroidota bacterium]MDP4242600.1 hypothetical protein [Bacteroidota bacterium]MDP4289176.1 hypothetical protein [Bacteroidota bacterium]